ncbi:MAG: hypothetical protein KDD02_08190 [Phaeodactylibacter sp.]|nr:hypothetical protein [Phaeodactylibacter sp.]
MAPISLSFYALNDSFLARPLPFVDGKITDPAWENFQPVLDSVIASALKLNCQPVLDYGKTSSSGPNQIIVLLADPPYHFSDPITFQNLIEKSELRPLGSGNPKIVTEKGQKNTLQYHPILTIGYEDIMPLFTESEEEEKARRLHIRGYELDARFKFLDASIWHRYVPIYPDDNCPQIPGRSPKKENKEAVGALSSISGNHFKAALELVLAQMVECHRQGLYLTNAAKAMLEFQLRMLQASYIIPFGEQNHAKFVTPFKFHSETQMQGNADQLCQEYFQAFGLQHTLQWRFLLVDDYANAPISTDSPTPTNTSKKTLIESLLPGFKIDIDYPKESGETGERSATKDILEKSLEKIAGNDRYDILLLDYLLATTKGGLEREYGYEFLQKLQLDSQQDTPQYKRGPFMRHWIFPISSFPFALYDKLRQLGIDNYHELWHLSGGGDPITTPQLFRYYLLSFMRQQVEEIYLNDKELEQYLKNFDYLKNIGTWSEVMKSQLAFLKAQILLLDSDKKKHGLESSLLNEIKTRKYDNLINLLYEAISTAYEVHFGEKTYSELLQLLDKLGKISPIHKKALKEKIDAPKHIAATLIDQAAINGVMRLDFSGANSPVGSRLMECPSNLGSISRLRVLNLSDNLLEHFSITPSSLEHLSEINLRKNRLRKIPLQVFELKALDRLDLRDNKINYLNNTYALAEGEQQIKNLKRIAQNVIELENSIKDYLKSNDALSAIDAFKQAFSLNENLNYHFYARLEDINRMATELKDKSATFSNHLKSAREQEITAELLQLHQDFFGS